MAIKLSESDELIRLKKQALFEQLKLLERRNNGENISNEDISKAGEILRKEKASKNNILLYESPELAKAKAYEVINSAKNLISNNSTNTSTNTSNEEVDTLFCVQQHELENLTPEEICRKRNEKISQDNTQITTDTNNTKIEATTTNDMPSCKEFSSYQSKEFAAYFKSINNNSTKIHKAFDTINLNSKELQELQLKVFEEIEAYSSYIHKDALTHVTLDTKIINRLIGANNKSEDIPLTLNALKTYLLLHFLPHIGRKAKYISLCVPLEYLCFLLKVHMKTLKSSLKQLCEMELISYNFENHRNKTINVAINNRELVQKKNNSYFRISALDLKEIISRKTTKDVRLYLKILLDMHINNNSDSEISALDLNTKNYYKFPSVKSFAETKRILSSFNSFKIEENDFNSCIIYYSIGNVRTLSHKKSDHDFKEIKDKIKFVKLTSNDQRSMHELSLSYKINTILRAIDLEDGILISNSMKKTDKDSIVSYFRVNIYKVAKRAFNNYIPPAPNINYKIKIA